MAKKNPINAKKIVDHYMDYVLTHSEPPKSVNVFAKNHHFQEWEFYSYFSSFEQLEKEIFKLFFQNTLEVMAKSKDYDSYSAQDKLLSFYFTFFEMLTANRSYVMYALSKSKNPLKGLRMLTVFKEDFQHYIKGLSISTMDLKNENLNKLQEKGVVETAWGQLMFTLKFWMDDTSPSFEKTDILIEKSVKASFDLLTNLPLQNVVDLGKFIFKEKIYSK